MADAASSSEAREYLRLIQTVPAELIGPHRRFNDPAKDAVAIRALASRVTAAVVRADERTYLAPSPWHAAAWLLDVAALAGQEATVDADSGLKSPFAPKYGAPVFRGQGDPDWRLTPGALREPRDPLDAPALELFIAAVAGLFEIVAEDTRMNGRHVHLAAAQHYGMRTPLLDFTADPRTAVFFANEGARPDRDRRVAVYGIPLMVLASLGGAVVLPPPWVHRLYAQRGLFLDCVGMPADLDLRELCFRVLFPLDDAFASSILPGGVEVLLKPDPWYEKAVAWARETARATAAPADIGRPANALKRDCGVPPFMWDAIMPAAMKPSLDGFVDMCEWLALKAIKGTLTYDCGPIVAMWRHNEPLFRSHRVLWKLLNREFGNLGPEALRQNRMLAALEAVTACVEEKAAG